MLSRHLRVEDRVISHLLGGEAVDPSLRPLLLDPDEIAIADSSPLVDALDRGVGLVYLRDRIGSAATAVAASALSRTGTPVICLDLERMGTDDEPLGVTSAAVREARLRGAGLITGPIDGFDPPISARDRAARRCAVPRRPHRSGRVAAPVVATRSVDG